MDDPLRADLIRYGRSTWERGLLVGLDGNLSARGPAGTILCTRASCHKGFLQDSDLLVVDLAGRRLSGSGEPTSELPMHLAIYEERPDVGAILHAHPPHAIACTLAGIDLESALLPEVVLTLGGIPTIPYARTGTRALADAVRPFARRRDAFLLERHGAVGCGRDLLGAFCALETIEHAAKIALLLRGFGGGTPMDPEEAAELRRLGLLRYGGPAA